MPDSHQAVSGWSSERFLAWAARVGPATRQIVAGLLASRRHPQQAFRSCLGLLSLAKRDSPELLEHACRRALSLGVCSYREIRMLLEPPKIRQSVPGPFPDAPTIHDNLRGPEYYATLDTKGDPPC